MAAALLAGGESVLGNIELCDDTRHALEAIQALGATVTPAGEHAYSIRGGLDPQSETIDIGESGLAARLLTPIAALSGHRITITGKGSMAKRPVGMMIKPLTELGVAVESDDFLPITVQGPLRGGEAEVDGYVSSQFVTGLMMALPLAAEDTILHVENANSIPYLAMTADMASKFGINIEHNDFAEFFIRGGQKYAPARIDIEGDWSGAAFMLVAGAVAGGVTAVNMNPLSLQADVAVIDALRRAGAEITTTVSDIAVGHNSLRGFEFNATHCPDLFPVLTVLAANCEGTSVIEGARRLIYKESDRAGAILEEFTRIGIDVRLEDDDRMVIKGAPIKGGEVDSRGDHRIAMAAAIAGLTAETPIVITGAEAVTKSYPRFWDDLASLTGNRP